MVRSAGILVCSFRRPTNCVCVRPPNMGCLQEEGCCQERPTSWQRLPVTYWGRRGASNGESVEEMPFGTAVTVRPSRSFGEHCIRYFMSGRL